MTKQEILILSFFDTTIGKEMKDNDLTSEMIAAGIGTNSASLFPFYEIIHSLKNQNLLQQYRDLTNRHRITRAKGTDLLVLTDKASQILTTGILLQKHQEFVDELEFNKLKTEHDLLTLKLADYYKTKRQVFWAIIISIISALAAIAALFKK